MRIYKSRFTPGLKNGEDVSFNKGEEVTYRLRSGGTIKIIIDSDLMEHAEAPGDKTGYESIFSDDGGRYFAVRSAIIDWKGKDKLEANNEM